MTSTHLHVLQPDLTCLVPRRCNFWPVRNRPSIGDFIFDTILNLLSVYCLRLLTLNRLSRSVQRHISFLTLEDKDNLVLREETTKYLYE